MTTANDLPLKIKHIKHQPCFNGLTDEEIMMLADLLTLEHIPAGQDIVIEGDPVDSVYFIVEGTADVRHVSIEDHKPKINSIAALMPNDVIGLNETGFYSLSGVRTATVTAKTNMTLYRLSVASFHGFALAYSHVNKVMRKNSENMMNFKL